MPDPSTLSQAKAPHSQHPDGAPESPQSGAKVALSDVCGEKTVRLPLSAERPVMEGVEAPWTEGWTPWPTGLHATEGEKKKKEQEERKKK